MSDQDLSLKLSQTPEGPPVTGTTANASTPTPLAGLPSSGQVPRVPDVYRPGYTSLVKQQQETSMWDTISNVLMNAGTQPGNIPTSIKLKLAQQHSALEADNQALEWQKYSQTIQVYKDTLEQHRKANIAAAMEMTTNGLAQLNALPPAERPAHSRWLKKAVDSLAPGSGGVFAAYDKSPYSVVLFRALAADQENGGPIRKLIADNGIENVLHQPEAQSMVKYMAHDAATMVGSHIVFKDATKLSAGTLGEDEFRPAFKKAAYDMGWSLDKITAMDLYLESPEGEKWMQGYGVQTDQLKQERATATAKHQGIGTGNPMNAIKAAEFKQNQFKINNADSLGLNAHDIELLQHKNNILERTELPQGNPGQSRSDVRANTLSDLSGGRYQTDSDIQTQTKAGSPERAQALAWAKHATQAKKDASAQASLGARMQEPAPLEKLTNVFSAKTMFKDHRLEGVGPQSTQTLRSNPDNFTASPDEQLKYSNIIKSKAAGKSLFDMASKVFTATSTAGLTWQAGKMGALNNQLSAPAVTATNPELATYHDVLEAWAGNNAKALGGEVGVLTNVDIDRWVRTFPRGADTPAVIKMKYKIFTQMLDLVRDTQEGILAGRLTPQRDATGTIINKDIRQKIEGLIGSAEGLTNETPGTQPQSRGESLLERMKAGR